VSVLESAIEREVCRHAERKGWVALKLHGAGDTGKPDRLFLGPGAQVLFIEFKKPGGEVRKLQKWWIRKLRRLGFKAYIIDSAEVGNAIFD
jgi:Holliday junction resolvase